MAFNPMPMRWNKLYKGTPAELALEDAVAALGIPYRTQFPGFLYGFRFFPDFLLPTLQVVIEVDDDSHKRTGKIIEDQERSEKLEQLHGWQVVRIPNAAALADPHGAVRAALMNIGQYPVDTAVRGLKIADFMPKTKKCPPKERREAKSRARQRKRGVIIIKED